MSISYFHGKQNEGWEWSTPCRREIILYVSDRCWSSSPAELEWVWGTGNKQVWNIRCTYDVQFFAHVLCMLAHQLVTYQEHTSFTTKHTFWPHLQPFFVISSFLLPCANKWKFLQTHTKYHSDLFLSTGSISTIWFRKWLPVLHVLYFLLTFIYRTYLKYWQKENFTYLMLSKY